MHLVVKADAVYFHRVTAAGVIFCLYYAGSPLPDDMAVEDASRLLDLGMIVWADDAPGDPPPVSPSGDVLAQLADVRTAVASAMSSANAAGVEATAAASLAEQARETALELAVLAANYQQALTASQADRQGLHQTDAQQAALITALQQQVDTMQLTPGPAGSDGKSVELRLNGTVVEWRQVGGSWSTLIPLAQITGPKGSDGVGAAGTDGKSAELRLNGPNVEWRQSGGSWATLVPLASITGPRGTDGTNGTDGKSAELQTTATAVQWRQAGGVWADLILLAALKGAAGTDGKSVELQKTATAIQWRVVGGSWADLVLLSALTGAAGTDGRQVELQKTATAIQWRLTGGTWADLVLLADIKGNTGTAAPKGASAVVTIPAAISLTPATREITVTWPRTLANNTYDVDICPDTTLAIGGPYTFAIKTGTSKTTGSCVLQYTNASLILSLGAATVDLHAYP